MVYWSLGFWIAGSLGTSAVAGIVGLKPHADLFDCFRFDPTKTPGNCVAYHHRTTPCAFAREGSWITRVSFQETRHQSACAQVVGHHATRSSLHCSLRSFRDSFQDVQLRMTWMQTIGWGDVAYTSARKRCALTCLDAKRSDQKGSSKKGEKNKQTKQRDAGRGGQGGRDLEKMSAEDLLVLLESPHVDEQEILGVLAKKGYKRASCIVPGMKLTKYN